MKYKNNIIYIGTAYPYRGGLAGYNERLTREFVKDGHRIELYNFSLQYPNFLFPGATQFSEEEGPKDISIVRKINSVNPFNWLKVGFDIKKKNPDFIIIKYWLPFMAPCFGTILRLAKMNKHTKVICIIDNIVPHEDRQLDKLFTRYFVGAVDGFISMSKEVQNQLSYFDQKKPRLLSPHPIFDHFGDRIPRAEALKHLGLDENYKYILFFGFIRDYKGLDWLLKAFAKVKDQIPEVKLLIAGEYYTDKKTYEDILAALNLGDRVVLKTEFIQDSQVKFFFSATDLLALPYKLATQSGVTQIGFHYEIPMLVTAVGGLPEMIRHGENGLVVQPNVDSIAEGLISFFKEVDVEQIKKGLKLDKAKYSWSVMKDKILELGANLTNNKNTK